MDFKQLVFYYLNEDEEDYEIDIDKRGKKERSEPIRFKSLTTRKLEPRDYQEARKIIAVMKKGGKCSRCGYDKYIGALHFHHKDFKFADENKVNKSYDVKEEAQRKSVRAVLDDTEEGRDLQLLCANCHAETHHVGKVISVEEAKKIVKQNELFDEKDIEQARIKSNSIIFVKDDILKTIQKILSPSAYKKNIDVLKSKPLTAADKQNLNNEVLDMLENERNLKNYKYPVTLKSLILKQKETIEKEGSAEDKRKFYFNVKKIEELFNSYYEAKGINSTFSFNFSTLKKLKELDKTTGKKIQKLSKQFENEGDEDLKDLNNHYNEIRKRITKKVYRK